MDADEYLPRSLKDWRKWLQYNHEVESSVWLVFIKKNLPNYNLSVSEAVEEALCWGWVDSRKRSRNEESYVIYFSPRKPNSNWSRVNKEIVARMKDEGRMKPLGRSMVELAKQKGTWDALNDVEELKIPADLMEAFDKVPQSLAKFDSHPKWVKRASLEWLFNAKRTETRSARIQKLVDKSAKGERVF